MVLCPLQATSAWSASPPLMPGPTWAPPLAGRLRPARGLLAGRRMPCRPPRKWWPRLLAGRHMPCRPPRKWCTPMPTGGQRPRHPSAWHCQPLPRGHGWTKSPLPDLGHAGDERLPGMWEAALGRPNGQTHGLPLFCAQHGAAMAKAPDHAVSAQGGQLTARTGKRRRVRNVHTELVAAVGLAAPGLLLAGLPFSGWGPFLQVWLGAAGGVWRAAAGRGQPLHLLTVDSLAMCEAGGQESLEQPR